MWKSVDRFEEYACAGLVMFVATLAFANVIVRYLTTSSLAFTEELVVNLFVWITVLGAAIAFRRKAQSRVTFLTQSFPPRYQKYVSMLSGACGAVLFSILFAQGIGMVAQEYANGMTTYSMALPMWWFGLAVPGGAIILLARAVQAALQEARAHGASPAGDK